MPTAEDGALTRLYTSQHSGSVEDDAPNQPGAGGPGENSYDLHLEAVAGDVLGGGGNPYTLTITAFDVTAGTAAPALNPTAAQLNNPQSFSGPTWAKVGDEYVTEQTFTIPAAGNLPAGLSGHTFIYTASLVSKNNLQVWKINSNEFTLC
jgi:hypothetical protein